MRSEPPPRQVDGQAKRPGQEKTGAPRPESSPWPLATSAAWRVLAWPDWKSGADLIWLLGTLGPALAAREACLCLRHDPELDGPSTEALARLDAVLGATFAGGGAPEIILIREPLSDQDWERLAASVNAKARLMPNWTDDPRHQRLDRVPVREVRTVEDVGRLLSPDAKLRPLDRWRMEFASVPGWFNGVSVGIWDSLLTLQTSAGIRGRFLEIGVWKGRSALLSALHAEPAEECVFVDPVLRAEARQGLQAVHPDGLHFIEAPSRALSAGSLPGYEVPSYRYRRDDGSFQIAGVRGAPSYRWIHIDGEHTGVAVAHDLAIAAQLIGERGIICVDDFFSPCYPQITFAVLDHLRANARSLMLFLCGCNKGYLCHPADARWLFAHVAQRLMPDLTALGLPETTLFKTTDPLDLNCFGITTRDHWGSALFRGPDWAQSEISF
jgi:hypothetical protein